MVGAGQLPGVGGTNGTTYKTSAFTAAAGDTLRYFFNYVSSDGQSAPGEFVYEDYTWAQLQDTVGNVVATLITARTEPSGNIIPGAGIPIPVDAVLTPSSVTITGGAPTWSPLGTWSNQCWGPGCGYTNWVQSDYTIQNGGTYVLAFGVSNWGDQIYDSGLAFAGLTVGGSAIPGEAEDDEIEIATPLPAALPMFAGGLGVIGIIAARRKRKTRA